MSTRSGKKDYGHDPDLDFSRETNLLNQVKDRRKG